jgi:DNA modification methylase
MGDNRIICGNALDVLKTLPADSVSCVVTSPPYFHLRKYGCEFDWPDGWRGELGLEPTIAMFLDHLIAIFDEIKRVLRPDGTCWVNIADKYHNATKWNNTESPQTLSGGANRDYTASRIAPQAIAEKSMCGIPERFMLRMMDSGWILRQKIIWAKGISFCDTYAGSCMPDSAKDRFNKNGFEPLYFFTKTGNYYFEQQYEDATETNEARPRMGQGNQTQYNQKAAEIYNGQSQKDYKGHLAQDASETKRRILAKRKATQEQSSMGCGGTGFVGHTHGLDIDGNPLGSCGGTKRILRNVWAINPEPSKEKHYAAYPTALVEPCISAGCPKEICVKCGKPRMPIYKPSGEYAKKLGMWTPESDKNKNLRNELGFGEAAVDGKHNACVSDYQISYSDCGCSAGFRPGIVLDPFGGMGTTGAVAVKLKRDYILIEGKQEYITDIANLKLQEAETGVTVDEQRRGQKALFE